MRFKGCCLVVGVCLLLAVSIKGQAQTPSAPDSPTAGSAVAANPQAVVPRLMKFNGVLRDVTGKPVTGPVNVTFALYSSDAGGNPLWFETQSVEADEQGRYTALIGVMHSEGLPMDLFTTGEARWLGVQVANEVEQKPRVLLLSVPYALKASDAETLGGLPASSYMLSPSASNSAGSAGQTTSTASVQAASTGNEGTTSKKGSASRKNAACSSLTADGNASANQIALYSAPCALSEDANLVDVGGKVGIGTADPTEGGQVGSRFTLSTATDAATGFSIFTGAAKRFAINTQSSGGFLFYDGQGAVWNPGLSQVGGNVGIGTADPTMSGQVGSRLTISTSTDSATGFSIFTGSAKRFALNPQSSGGFLIYDGGGGAWNPGLSQVGGKVGIGTAAPTQPLQVAGNLLISGVGNALIFPDGTVQATAGTGSGGGTITGVKAGTDLTGGGASGNVTLNLDTTTVPTLAATSNVFIGSITASNFSGNGSGLTSLNPVNLAPGTADISVTGNAATATAAATATNALALGGLAPSAFEQVVDKNVGNGYAGLDSTARIARAQAPSTTVFTDAGNAFTAGTQDLSGAGSTLPVKSVLSANTPSNCVAERELLIKTDAVPAGQQMFICNSTGDGWVLVGDGVGSGGVTSFNGRTGAVQSQTGDYSFSQISGTVGALQLSGTYSNAVTFSSSGNSFNGTHTGNGSGLNSLNASSLASGTVPSSVISGTYSNAVTFSSSGNSFNGTHTGNGSGLNSLNASSLASGTVPSSVISGTYSNAVTFSSSGNSFNGTHTGSGSGLNSLNASNLASGTVPSSVISGTYSNAVTFSSSGNSFNGTHTGSGSGLNSLNASNLASGTVPSSVISGSYNNTVDFNSSQNVFSGYFTGNWMGHFQYIGQQRQRRVWQQYERGWTLREQLQRKRCLRQYSILVHVCDNWSE